MEPDKKEQVRLRKTLPTFFPFGFSMSGTNDSMIIIQFLDQSGDEEQNIIASVALTKQRAKLFAEKLLEVIETNKNEP